MPRYKVTLTEEETQQLKAIIRKGGKGYRIRHAQILLKLDEKPENKSWTMTDQRGIWSIPQHDC